MAISDVLLKGALTFKTFLDKGEEGLKSEDFRGGRHLWMAPYNKVSINVATVDFLFAFALYISFRYCLCFKNLVKPLIVED